MWFYIPKNRAQIKRSEKAFYADNIYKKYRRNKWWNYWKIRQSLWTFAFLIIAVRVGGVAFLSMFNLEGYVAAQYVYNYKGKLSLPAARVEKSWGSNRNLVLLSIHRNGYIMVEGNHYENEELPQVLSSKLWENPRVVAGLIIDKNCPMEHTYTVLRALKKAKIYRVKFITKAKGTP